jgi:hypothetical protein
LLFLKVLDGVVGCLATDRVTYTIKTDKKSEHEGFHGSPCFQVLRN